MKSRKKLIIWTVVFVLAAVLTIWTAWANRALTVTQITVRSEMLPEQFSKMRIAHLSDLHNTQFGQDNEELIEIIREQKPDIIVITGDLVDSRNTDIDVAVSFAEKAVEIAPVYYVTGNHESRIDEFPDFEERLLAAGVTVLRDSSVPLEKGGAHINIVGIDDPDFSFAPFSQEAQHTAGKLERLCDEESFTILLSHRPELFEVYVQYGVDLALSGHAHGGQFRLPVIGGVVAPDQGLFPKYDSGLYTSGRTNMYVSRGLGNSIFPFRVNNRPEIVMIELKAE